MKHLLTLAFFFCLGTFASAQIPSYVPTNGLVGWWPFNGNANDESGNGNNGTVNGATLAADRFGNAGKAYSFDGVDDWIRCIQSGPTGNPTISVNFWIKSPQSTYGHIIGYGSNGGGGENFRIYLGENSCSQSIVFDTYDNAIAKTNSLANIWDFYTVIYNGVNGSNVNSTTIYKNGVPLLSNCFFVNISNTNISNNYPITFGKYHGTIQTGFFNGLLDDIAIYNRALSAAEVQQLYTGQSAPVTKSASTLFHYQALVSNSQKKPLANQSMAVRFTIADSLVTYYAETQQIITDSKGQFSTKVGNGTPVQGSMASIPWWDAVSKTLKTEIDTNASGQWITLGQQPMAAVPIAMYAQSTGDGVRSVFGSFDTSANIQTGSGFTVTSNGNNQYEVQFSSSFSNPPILQVELVGVGTYSYKTVSSQVQKFVVQVLGNPDRIQFEAKGK